MEKEKHYNEWTRKEFEALPKPNCFTNQEIGEVDCLIILPQKHRHDSGYRCMSFVTIQNNKPTYIISGCSDVIHLGGIGGFNIRYITSNLTYQERIKEKKTPAVSWSIDCLPTSGLLRLFCDKRMYVGASLSSFEIFFKEE
ncbi:MAG: hypothetical protein II298_03345 [Bacteroidales bacterium]|nr:hypothetical protein [Bacteroidales bacterium]